MEVVIIDISNTAAWWVSGLTKSVRSETDCFEHMNFSVDQSFKRNAQLFGQHVESWDCATTLVHLGWQDVSHDGHNLQRRKNVSNTSYLKHLLLFPNIFEHLPSFAPFPPQHFLQQHASTSIPKAIKNRSTDRPQIQDGCFNEVWPDSDHLNHQNGHQPETNPSFPMSGL